MGGGEKKVKGHFQGHYEYLIVHILKCQSALD